MGFQQKLLEKDYFIFKMTGLTMVRPASSDFWKAPLECNHSIFSLLLLSSSLFLFLLSFARTSCSSVVSSAKISIEDLDGCSGVSLTNKRNKIGRNTEPCGTPCFIVSRSDLCPVLVTNCFLSEGYDVNQ